MNGPVLWDSFTLFGTFIGEYLLKGWDELLTRE